MRRPLDLVDFVVVAFERVQLGLHVTHIPQVHNLINTDNRQPCMYTAVILAFGSRQSYLIGRTRGDKVFAEWAER